MFVLFIFTFVISACSQQSSGVSNDLNPETNTEVKPIVKKDGTQSIGEYTKGKGYEIYEVATFAGGCFWCTEASFECIEGVKDVISGYSGGNEQRPTYYEVGGGKTGHAEAIQIYYNPEEISFTKLLEIFFVAHDPTQVNRQGPDVGEEYRSAIYYHNEQQKKEVETFFKSQAKKFTKAIATEVAAYKEFWVAEDYHQDYYWLHPENSYVQNVSVPKVMKVQKKFGDLLKEDCGK